MWQRMKRTMSLLTLISMMTALLAGCGGDTSTATTAPSGAAPTTAPAGGGAATTAPGASDVGTATTAPAGGGATATTAGGGAAATTGTGGGAAMTLPANCSNVQLSYWNPFTGPDGPFMGKLVDKFNAANPNIKVTMTTQADYYVKLGTSAASDQLPDVAIVHADQLATQVWNNVIRPIDDIAGQIGIGESDYPAAVWAPGNINGHRYSIPLDIHPMTMYYNEDLLKKAGMTAAPTNRADFEKAAAAMTSGANHGFDITSGFPISQIFLMLLHQFGGETFNADGTQAAWNSDAGVKALTWMKDAQTKYSAPKLAVDAELNAFKTGTVGMVWNGIWQITNVTGTGVEFAGKATAVPQIGDKMAVWAGSHQLTLPVHKSGADKCKDAAAAIFIRFAVDNSIEWAKAGQIPAANKVRNGAEFKAIQPQASIAPAVESAFFPPAGVPGITDALGAPLDNNIGAIMSGTATDIKATLDKSVTQANQLLKANKDKYGSTPKAP